jgi:hypothetical protein
LWRSTTFDSLERRFLLAAQVCDATVICPSFEDAADNRGQIVVAGVGGSLRISAPASLEEYSCFGSSSASIGDLDGDGVNDMILGAGGPYVYAAANPSPTKDAARRLGSGWDK